MKTYGEILTQHVKHPRHVGRVSPGPSGHSIMTNETSGDALRLALRIDGSTIVEAKHRSFGNPALIGSADFVAAFITGKDVHVAAQIDAMRVAEALQLSPGDAYCAQLVVLAMLEAVQDYNRRHGFFAGQVRHDS